MEHGPCSASWYDGADAIRLVMRQECPDNPGVLMGQRDGRPVLAASGAADAPPSTAVIRRGIDPAARGSRAVHEACTEIAIPACPHPAKPWLTSCGGLPRDQAQPGGPWAAVRELGGIPAGGDERGGRDRADPREGRPSLTCRRGLTYRGQLLVVRRQALLQGQQLLVEVPEDLGAQCGQFRLCFVPCVSDQRPK